MVPHPSESEPNGTSRNSTEYTSCFIIGVAGGTASGKTTVCDYITQRLRDQCVVMLAQDSFYRGLNDTELRNVQDYNFDEPSSLDVLAMVECLQHLKAGMSVEVPIYDFKTHQRSPSTRKVPTADVIIIEGILILHIPEIREMLNMKIFVDTDDDVRLARRIQRDVSMRGRCVDNVITQYTKFVKPSFDQYVAPSRKFADIIIPWQRGDNLVAIDLITEHIRMKLNQHDLRRIYPNLQIMPSNFQTKCMHTIIRDQTTSKTDFVFYSDRLNRLLVEAGLGHLPFKEKAVLTPTGCTYVGVEFAKKLCGVSIIRSGESMENALRDCCKSVKIGKILVHKNKSDTSDDQNHQQDEDYNLIYEKLPRDIADRYVFLMDPIIGTGRSATRCIEILKSRGVEESKILFLNLIAAPQGVHQICTHFPGVKLITTEIDDSIDENYRVVPGIGEFGDRYFCD
eukprot:g2449.t1